VIENKICEGTGCLNAALSSCVISLQGVVAPARSVGWTSNEALSLLYLVPWPSTPTYTVKTQDSKHPWFTPLMIFSIHIVYISLLPLLFLRSVSIWSGCPVINIRRCHEDMKLSWIGPICISSAYKVSLLHTSYLSLMIMAALTTFQARIWVYTQKYARLWKYLGSYRKLVNLCRFCLCGIRSWKSHVWSFLGMKEFLDLLQRCWIGEASPIPWPGRSCEFYPSRQCFLTLCHRTHLYSTIWHSPDGRTRWNWTCFEIWSFLGLYVRSIKC
jgi:hypothetical protein